MNGLKYVGSGILILVFILLAGCTKRSNSAEDVALPPSTDTPALTFITPDANAFAHAEPNQIVFDMRYRGLDPREDGLLNRGSYGYGGTEEETPFITDLKSHGVKNIKLVHNFEFMGAETCALQMYKGKPVAFFIDLNTDGKVTANEKMLPFTVDNGNETFFLTPDFSFKNRYQKRCTIRALIRAQGEGRNLWCGWSPSCVLEGETKIGNEPARLTLLSAGLSGSFSQFGRSYASLQVGDDQLEKQPGHNTLSRLIWANEHFYRLNILHPTDRPSNLRVVLEEDTLPRGRLRVKLHAGNLIPSEIRWARVQGATGEEGISLALPTDSMALPMGAYRLDRGALYYGTKTNEKAWTVDFDTGPVFTVKAEEESAIKLGQPKLQIQAVNQRDRYQSNPQTQTTYKRGTRIYLNRQVAGQAGESYGRFEERRSAEGRRYREIEPHIRIANPQGKQILSKDLEYG